MKCRTPDEWAALRADFAAFLVACAMLACFGAALAYATT